MAAPLQLIKKGIEKGDWSLVAQGYNSLTGEELEIEPSKNSGTINMASVIEFLSNIEIGVPKTTKPIVKEKRATKPVKKNIIKVKSKVIKDSENEPLNMNKLPKVPMRSGAVGGNKKMFEPAAHLYDEDEAEANLEYARDDEPRESYKPQMAKCKCGYKFDVKKVYPGGIIDKSVEPVCEECLSKRSKK